MPKLHTGKNWYIDFKAYDPLEQKMKRKKYMLDSIDKISVRKKRATELIANISRQLLSGWNPWADTSNSRQYTLFDDVVELYNKYLIKFHKSKVFKESTFADYKKRIRVLSEYNKKRFNPIIYIYQFDKTYASDFLDYILIDRDSSARTRNNYRTWLSSFGSWLLEKQYIDKNPVENIKSLSEDKKKRDALSANDLQKLRTYLEKNNPYFLLLCQFAYYTLIRPDELSNIQLSDIYIKDQKVFNYSNDCYLFGKDFKPSKEKSTPRTYRTYFNKVRTLLKFPDSYQFYSLKDTGIRDLANSAGIVIARDQARHSDISTTNKYLKGEALPVHEETKHFEGLF